MEIGVVPSERSSVLQIYYVAPGATLSQCLVWDRMNALIALLPLDRTGGCVTMVHTTRRILSLIIAAPIKRPYIWDLAPLGECDPKLPSVKIGCTFTGVAVRIPTHRQQRP